MIEKIIIVVLFVYNVERTSYVILQLKLTRYLKLCEYTLYLCSHFTNL